MNRKMVFHIAGKILVVEAALFLLPLVTALCYHEWTVALSFFATSLIALAIGGALSLLIRPKNREIFAREGFAIVALGWFFMSLVGALPFVFSREIPSFIDAFFETVSGLTTTGASILTDVEAMSHGLLFWRSFTHWIGGMGVLVFVMAILPTDSGRSIHIMRAEMPGPIVGKLVPKIRETAKILYFIYIALTVVMIGMLLLGGMSFYESLIHSFGTAGTGGFGIKSDSIAAYSPYIQWVITIFMLIFGINFNLFYLVLLGKLRSALRSSELWCYLGIVTISVIAIAINIASAFDSLSDTIRHSFFQVASIITTTGFCTTDFNLWPNLSKTILLILMFIGGCAGSTAGGLKVSRIMLLVKTVRRDLKKMLHPRSVAVVKLEGKTIDEQTISNTASYLILYFLIFFVILLLVSFEPFGFETTFSSVASCFNNIGPAFGAAGPYSNYAAYTDFSTLLLSFAMLLGRLEIFPILLALSPSTWTRK